jgi:NAD(P)-dependent dehydrogenase (short-subunit alcohol dehydrogenase family)
MVLLEEVIDRHGCMDILVNNAGITTDRRALQMSAEDWNEVIRVNLSARSSCRSPRSPPRGEWTCDLAVYPGAAARVPKSRDGYSPIGERPRNPEGGENG